MTLMTHVLPIILGLLLVSLAPLWGWYDAWRQSRIRALELILEDQEQRLRRLEQCWSRSRIHLVEDVYDVPTVTPSSSSPHSNERSPDAHSRP